jgi:hypothetical protein
MKLAPHDALLYVLLGACSRSGQAEMYCLGHENDFEPTLVSGVKVVGFPGSKGKFERLFNERMHDEVEEALAMRRRYPQIPIAELQPMPVESAHVAMIVTAILSSLVESGADRTIGGQIQCAVIDKDGVMFPEISYSTAPDQPAPKWTKATATRAELVTVTGAFDTLRLYSLAE